MSSTIWKPKENYFPTLLKLVKDEGLYEPNIRIPIIQFFRATLSFGVCLWLARMFPHPLVVAALAVLGAFFVNELGYIMHDAGHRQCSKKTKVNDWLGFLATGIVGIPFTIWIERHNEHHNNPNHEDEDPDLDIPFVAFSEQQVHQAKKKGFKIAFISHQTWFYLPLLTFAAYSKRYFGLMALMQKGQKTIGHKIDIASIVAWHIWYPAVLIATLGLGPAILFFFVQQAMSGFFFGMVFAPNHKGMPILEKSMNLDFMTRQIVTSRNIKSNALIDYLFGGLNYQIEHHLYPNMPRYNLPRAKQITEAFCKQNSIPYHETSLLGSYIEIYRALDEIAEHAKVLRQPKEDICLQILNAITQLKDDIAVVKPVTESIEASGELMKKRLSEIEEHVKNSDIHIEILGEWRHEILEFSKEVMDWFHAETQEIVENAKSELNQMIRKVPPQKVAAIRFTHEKNMKRLAEIQMNMVRRRNMKKAALERKRKEVADLLAEARQRVQLLKTV